MNNNNNDDDNCLVFIHQRKSLTCASCPGSYDIRQKC